LRHGTAAAATTVTAPTTMTASPTATATAIGKGSACEHQQSEGNEGSKQGGRYPHDLTVPVCGQLDVARA
jgi:hypothetical protein